MLTTQPGAATVRQHADGTRTVQHADSVIQLTAEPWMVLDEHDVLQLDTAGRYRYQLVAVQTCTVGADVLVLRRIP